jgi:SpoIID/LytB domain protein
LLGRKLAHALVQSGEGVVADGDRVLVADLPPRVVNCRVPAIGRLMDLRVVQRGSSGRASEVEIDYVDAAGRRVCLVIRSEYRIRELLHDAFLYSSAFTIEIERDPKGDGEIQKVRLIGAGWGHGAGLCQIGALGMALKGYACSDILRHYFAGVDIRALY